MRQNSTIDRYIDFLEYHNAIKTVNAKQSLHASYISYIETNTESIKSKTEQNIAIACITFELFQGADSYASLLSGTDGKNAEIFGGSPTEAPKTAGEGTLSKREKILMRRALIEHTKYLIVLGIFAAYAALSVGYILLAM